MGKFGEPPFFVRKVTSRIIKKQDLPPLLKRIDLPDFPILLEIGCSDGYSLRIIQKYFSPKRLIGIDIDEKLLKDAKNWIEKKNFSEVIKIIRTDATNLPFKNNYFDGVFVFAVLHHIENWKKCLLEISRVLKPGGYFIFNEPLDKVYSIPFWKRIDRPLSIFSEIEFKELLNLNGFKILHWQRRGFYKKFLKASIEGIYKKSETKLKRRKKVVGKGF